jgi:hypothetical protein
MGRACRGVSSNPGIADGKHCRKSLSITPLYALPKHFTQITYFGTYFLRDIISAHRTIRWLDIVFFTTNDQIDLFLKKRYWPCRII